MLDSTPYLEAWRRRHRERAARDAALAGEAMELATQLAQRLGGIESVTKVVLVGSLARGDFREGSDIDLVVTGLPSGELFSVRARIQAEAGRTPVDLIPSESANALLLDELDRDGRVLYSGV